MTKRGIHIIGCLVIPFVILTFSVSPGQSAFNPDSLKKVLASGLEGEERQKALAEMAEGYLALDAYDLALSYCDSAIMMAISTGDRVSHASLDIIKGNALYYSQGPEASIIPYKECYRIYEQDGDSAGMAKALNGIGVMYKKMGQYDSALASFIQLARISELKGYEKTLGMGYVNMGILYQDRLNNELSLRYLKLSIPINKKYRVDLVGLAHMNIGLVNYDLHNYDEALVEFRKAQHIYDSLELRQNLADVYNNIGILYLDIKNLDSANYYYSAARDLYYELGSWYTYAQTLNNLGILNIYRENFTLAYQLLDSCIAVAVRTKNPELESTAYKNLHYGHELQGDYERALRYYMKHDSINDTLFSLNKEIRMADLEMRYQNEQKQAQILLLERDNLIKTKQNNIYLFTGLGIITLILFGFLYFRQRTVKDRIIAQQRIRQLEEEKKLLAARSLVEGQEEERKRIARELHDGLGVLLSTTRMQFSSISHVSPETMPIIEKASRLLEQASLDVRKISHNMMPGLLTKLGLHEAVADMLDKVSETEGLNVQADIPEDMERAPENKEIMIYRIIQELVNNTLKHAHAKNIEIRMRHQNGLLEIDYKDDGIGFDMDRQSRSETFGLNSIRSRIDFLNGTMQLQSAPGKGVSFRFVIPV